MILILDLVKEDNLEGDIQEDKLLMNIKIKMFIQDQIMVVIEEDKIIKFFNSYLLLFLSRIKLLFRIFILIIDFGN